MWMKINGPENSGKGTLYISVPKIEAFGEDDKGYTLIRMDSGEIYHDYHSREEFAVLLIALREGEIRELPDKTYVEVA
jgi:hypothetical protein